MSTPIPIAIIGTAGRDADAARLNADVFGRMVAATREVVAKLTAGAPWRAVSGGSAWADHVAVELFLSGVAAELELHIPAQLQFDGFVDNGQTGKDAWRTNPGGRLNELHFAFSASANRDSFVDFNTAATRPGFAIEMTPGFFPRNTRVAESAVHCVALTFGSGAALADGGTQDTMRKFLVRKGQGKSVHIDLNTMRAYSPARIGG